MSKPIVIAPPEADFVLVTNEHARRSPDWMRATTAAFAAHSSVGVLGSYVLHPNGMTVLHAGGHIERPRFVAIHTGHRDDMGHAALDVDRDVEFVHHAAIAVRRSLLDRVPHPA